MTRLKLILAVLYLAAWTDTGLAQQKVPGKIWEKARTDGVVEIIVNLNVPWRSDVKLNSPEMVRQKKDIANAQNQLLADLAGTKYKLRGRFEFVPGIALQVDSYILAILEKSVIVKSVNENSQNRLN